MRIQENEQQGFQKERLSTSLKSEDLILWKDTQEAVKQLNDWLILRRELQSARTNLSQDLNHFCAIFFGPEGTGKTLTATLLGKSLEIDVYRIDLSKVMSKYIGETEKNLSRLFDVAENSGFILFFDEADALFGKRTEVRDSHDKYANQEVSWLLQRIDSFNGMVILSCSNPPDKSLPVFKLVDLVVEFKRPDAGQRLLLWKKYLPLAITTGTDVNLEEVAKDYELTGGAIVNAIRNSVEDNGKRLSKALLLKQVTKEINDRQ